MKTEYPNKALTVYDEWIKRVGLLITKMYDMDIENYMPKYNFGQAYRDGLSPREAAERLAKIELDLP